MSDEFSANRSAFEFGQLMAERASGQVSDKQSLRKVTQEFESFFLQQILKNMRSANQVIGQDNVLNSQNVDFFNQMHDQQLAMEMSRKSHLGIGQILYDQFSRFSQFSDDDASKNPVNTIEGMPKNHAQLNPSEKKVEPTPTSTNAVGLLGEEKKSLAVVTDGIKNDLNNTVAPKVDLQESKAIRQVVTSSVLGEESTHSAAEQFVSEKVSEMKSWVVNSKDDFIEQLKPFAIEAAKVLNVSPGILIAQAALETGWGKFFSKSSDGENSFNLFGIKAQNYWQGESTLSETTEYVDGAPQKQDESFRVYQNVKDSFEDYVDFVANSNRYKDAVENSETDLDYVRSLQNAGYATDPNYSSKIYQIFVRENLDNIDVAGGQ